MFNLFGSKNTPQSPDSLYDKGKEALVAGNYSAAEKYLNQAITADPNHDLAWNELGVALAYLNKDKEALTAYLKAIALDQRVSVYYENAILQAGNMDVWDVVRKVFTDAMTNKIEIKSASCYNMAGLAFYYDNDNARAKFCYELAIGINPKEEVYRRNLQLALDAAAQDVPSKTPFAIAAQYPEAFIDATWESEKLVYRQAYGGGKWCVTSLNAPYRQQRFASRKEFPDDVISKAWKEDYDIIDIAYGNGFWNLILMKESG
jgi:tetratricopeptide (TPR) repeat protein